MGWIGLLRRGAAAVEAGAAAERERPASCDVAKPREVEEEEEEALRAAAGMAKAELSSVAVAMADGWMDGVEWMRWISRRGIRRGEEKQAKLNPQQVSTRPILDLHLL